MEASSTPTWEACKENVLPIKRGRSAKGLSESLQKNNEDLSENNSRDKIFEDSIIAAAKSSPKELLDAYSLYFKWTRDTYPTNTEKALKLLERCTCDLKDKEELRNDHRFVKMWIEYADMVKTPGEIFSFMQSNKIGEKVALFWIAWAYVAEKAENFKLTDQIFQKGIRRLAEPKDTLSKRYHQFQRRLARHYLNSMEGNPDNDDDIATPLTHTAHSSSTGGRVVHGESTIIRDLVREIGSNRGRERKPLGGLSAAQASSDNRQPSLIPQSHSNTHSLSHSQPLPTHTTAFAPARTSNAVSTSTSRGVRAVSTSSSVRSGADERASNATFRIFSDNPDAERAATELTENQNWRNLGTQSVKSKENDGPVMKWTDGGGLPVGTHTGPGQPVSGTHGSSSATAPLSSMISIFVDKEFENNEEDEEEEGNGEKGGGGGGVRGDLNSPHTKRPRTQILGGLRLRQQLEGAQQDSLISRIASNPLERHKRITETIPSSDQNSASEIRESEREKVSSESIRESERTSQENNLSIQPRHTAPTLPSTLFSTSTSSVSTFSIFEDKKPDKKKENGKQTTTATSFKIFDDAESERGISDMGGESALDRMRNKERERRVEREKEMEMERVREMERERRAKEIEREQDRERERAMEQEREKESHRRAEEQSSREREKERRATAKSKADADAGQHHADLDAMLLEMGVGDSEDGTINTRLARKDIDSMFCSPLSTKSDCNRKYENNDERSTKYSNNHDQIMGQNPFKSSNNFNTSNPLDQKIEYKCKNELEFKIFTDPEPKSTILNNFRIYDENKNTHENKHGNEDKDEDDNNKSNFNRISLDMDINNITSRKGSMDSLSSESLNFAWAGEGEHVHVHTLGASTSELSVIKEKGVNDYDYSIFGQLNTPFHKTVKDGFSTIKEKNTEKKNSKLNCGSFAIYSDNNDEEKNGSSKNSKTEKANFRHSRDEKTESDYNSLYLSGSSNSMNSVNVSRSHSLRHSGSER